MLDTTIHSVQSTVVCCVSGERTEKCVATLSTATAVCGLACWGWQLKTKQRNCRNCCLSVWVLLLLLHLRSQHSPVPALRHCGGNVWSISAGCHTLSTLPPPPRNNNNNSNDSPSDPLLATHATKTFIGERKDSTAVHCPIRILLVWWQNNLTTFSLIRFYIYCFLRCKI